MRLFSKFNLGMEKLGLTEEGLRIFDDTDGTEIDEDECLLEYEKGSIFIISKHWKAGSESEAKITDTAKTPQGLSSDEPVLSFRKKEDCRTLIMESLDSMEGNFSKAMNVENEGKKESKQEEKKDQGISLLTEVFLSHEW